MTDEELLQQDERLRAEADTLVASHRIIETLSEYGRTELYGSYSLQLMHWRDLDVYVLDDKLQPARFLDLCAKVAASLNAMELFYSNSIDHPKIINGRGLYAGVLLGKIEEGGWKLDIWAYGQGNWDWSHQLHSSIKSRLDGESRLKILRIKSMCWSRPEYRRRAWDYWKTEKSYGGFDIYKAVLDKGVNSFDDWERHLCATIGQNCAG